MLKRHKKKNNVSCLYRLSSERSYNDSHELCLVMFHVHCQYHYLPLFKYDICLFLQCVTASVKDHQKCSQCDAKVKEDNEQYKQYVQTLEFLFPTLSVHDKINIVGQSASPTVKDSTSHIVIATLSGDCTTIIYNPDQTILELKDTVEQKLKTPSNKQSLLYNDIELKVQKMNFNLAESVQHVYCECMVPRS